MKPIKIENPPTMGIVQQAMEADGHNVPCVTHYFLNNERECVGAFSVAYAPVLFFWMRGDQSGIASFRAMVFARHEIRKLGHHRIILPIQTNSPYYPYMEGLGLRHLGKGEIFIGEI